MGDFRVKKISGIANTLGQVSVPAGHDFRIEGKLNNSSTSALQIPSGSTADRPASPSTGYMRWNTTESYLEWYNGTDWVSVTRVGATASTIATNGLILHLDSGNTNSYPGTGTSWYDLSPNNLTATIQGTAPTYTSEAGGMFDWNGNGYATVDHTELRPTEGITMEAWFQIENANDNEVYIGSQYGSSSSNSYALWREGNTLRAGTNLSGTFSTARTVTYYLNAKQWYHFVYTFNGTIQTMYLNGFVIDAHFVSGSLQYDTSNTLLCIASDFNTGYNGGTGYYDMKSKFPICRIYNRALTSSEVLGNYELELERFQPTP